MDPNVHGGSQHEHVLSGESEDPLGGIWYQVQPDAVADLIGTPEDVYLWAYVSSRTSFLVDHGNMI